MGLRDRTRLKASIGIALQSSMVGSSDAVEDSIPTLRGHKPDNALALCTVPHKEH